MTMLSGCEDKTSKIVVVYLHTTMASFNGPFSWCARIVCDNQQTTEIGGVSLAEHDTRLTIVGMIDALNSIEQQSIVKLICSNYEYAVKYVLKRSDPAMEERLRESEAANLDLFPPLREAVIRHKAVEGIYVGRHDRDDEHLLTVAGAKKRLEMLKESSTFLSTLSPATAFSGDQHTPW